MVNEPNAHTTQPPKILLTTTTPQNNKNNSIYVVYSPDLVVLEFFGIFLSNLKNPKSFGVPTGVQVGGLVVWAFGWDAG